MNAEPAVRFDRVTHRYGETVAIDELSFDVRRGETFGLIGPDGAGKTTTLRSVLGLLRPAQGRITTLAMDPARSRRRLSRRVGYLSQRFSIYGDLSVDENVAFFAKAHEMRDWKSRREELRRRLGLNPFRNRLADQLSGGMKQKLALACTLVHTPELLVMDEPTTGVDPVSRREFWRILAELQRNGMTILITTPYLDEAERCQRVGLIEHGKLLVVDEPVRIRRSTGGSMLEVLAQPPRRARALLQARPEVGDVETFGERLHASLPEVAPEAAAPIVARLTTALQENGIAVRSVRAVEPSLEDVFIARLRARAPRGPAKTLLALLVAGVVWFAGGIASASETNPMAPAWETSATISLSLEQAIARAHETSPFLDRLEALAESARGAKREAAASQWPHLDATAAYTRVSEEETFAILGPGGELIEISPHLPDRWRMRLGVSWPLWTGGRVEGFVASAESSEEAARRDLESGAQDLTFEVTRAYWELVIGGEQIRVLERSGAAYDAHLADVENRLDVGMAASNDLLSIHVERDRAELALLEARNRHDVAQEDLRRLLRTAARVDPTEPLEASAPVTDTLAALQEEALAHRPERESLRARLIAAQARVRAERAGYFPELALNAGYDYGNPNARIVPPAEAWNDSWDVGVRVSWSLFDGGRTRGATERARAEVRALEAQLRDLDQRIRLDVFRRSHELQTAAKAVGIADRAVAAAEENLRVSRDRFRAGVLLSSDLLDAETRSLRSALDRTRAHAELRVTIAALARSLGRAGPAAGER